MKTCIHTVIYNEPKEYLEAWLNHHTKMVDHIFIFEDLDSHSHKSVTDNYPNVTLLSVTDICDEKMIRANKEKGRANQRYYLRDGILWIQSLKEYDWAFTIDIDEFITLQPPYKSVSEVLSDFQDRCAVLLQWQNIGACGRINKPDYQGRDYREFYTEPASDSDWDGKVCANTKIVWNLNKITKFNLTGIHCCAGDWVKTNGEKNRRKKVYDKMYLAHFLTKSFEEYLWKIYVRGLFSKDRHRKVDDFFQINTDMSIMYDECMTFEKEFKNKNNIK